MMQLAPVLLAVVVLMPALALLVWKTWRISKVVADTAAQLSSLAQEIGRLRHSDDEQYEDESNDSLELRIDERFASLTSKKAEPEPEREGETLAEDLEHARRDAEHNRRLYLLMKSLLERHELLRAARLAATDVSSPQATPEPATETVTTEEKPSSPADDDTEDQNAARIARVMVADLFLYSPNLTEKANSEDELRSFLSSNYKEARKTFESRVADRVRRKKDYLELEFERVLRERANGTGADADGEEQTEDNKEHQNAARIARVMVADLFLYNPAAEVKDITRDERARILKRQYREARKTFESRVPERVWREKDYLELEFERALQEHPHNTGAALETESAGEMTATQELDLVGDDKAHESAARLARIMVADLFLVNWELVEKGIREGQLRELLDMKYQAARRTFESRVAGVVWSETHYLDLQHEQLLLESQGDAVSREVQQALRARFDALSADDATASKGDSELPKVAG